MTRTIVALLVACALATVIVLVVGLVLLVGPALTGWLAWQWLRDLWEDARDHQRGRWRLW